MKKIISLFQRNYEGDRLVRNETVPGAEWVLSGEGVATRKFDGTCCMIEQGVFYKRYDVKKGRTKPDGFISAQDPDPDHLRPAAGHRDRADPRPVLGDHGTLAQRRRHRVRGVPDLLRRRDLGVHPAGGPVAQRGDGPARGERADPGRRRRARDALRLGRAHAEHERDHRVRHGGEAAPALAA